MSNFAPKSDRPAALKDVTRTFAESNVSVTHTDTAVSGESVRLLGGYADIPNSDGSFNTTGWRGVNFVPNVDISTVRAEFMADSNNANEARVVRDSDGTVMGSITGGPWSPNTEIELTGLGLSAGTEYRLQARNTAGWDYGNRGGGYTYPFKSAALDVVDSGSSPRAWTWVGGPEASSGNVIIEFGTPGTPPADVVGWDVAYFSATPDGETVKIYVEEAQGSPGWTEVAGPLKRGDAIPADPENDVRFRVEISRASTANNPTLDSILRRYKL